MVAADVDRRQLKPLTQRHGSVSTARVAPGGSGSRRTRGRAVAVVLAVTAALVPVGMRPALADGVSCTFDESSHTASITVSGTGAYVARIVRSGDTIGVGFGAGAPCGTVTTVDTIDLDMSGHGGQVMVDLDGGLFAPGFTDEADTAAGDTSEIEIVVRNAGSAVFSISGSDGPDGIAAGERFDSDSGLFWHTANLNVGAEPTGRDEDLRVEGTPAAFWIYSWGGADDISAAGTGTITSRPSSMGVVFRDGSGADVVRGGNGDDTFGPEEQADPGDTYAGGGGFDTLSFERYEDMTVSKNGLADDGIACPGTSCEADNIGGDIEKIVGGSADDTLLGSAGADWFAGGGGKNTLRGGGGNDTLLGGSLSEDTFFGGDGRDKVTYSGIVPFDPADGITASIDGIRNDGFPGSSTYDNVRADVEILEGTVGADRLSGNDGANDLIGLAGADRLAGGPGRDVLRPGPGDDVVLGGLGTDTAAFLDSPTSISADLLTGTSRGQGEDSLTAVEALVGSPFGDHLLGSDGPNRVSGGAGGDVLYGFDGDDVLLGGLGGDEFVGGGGSDTCIQGPGTGQLRSCEATS